ncbi:MAG: CoA-binding protein [Bacteroidales bacterium]|nr:CoA-binding protein [Bacteroidales bacterium]
MTRMSSIRNFFQQKHIAVAGVSRKKGKFGNTIFDELNRRDYRLYPLHPVLEEYGGSKCYSAVSALPEEVTALVVCTQPASTAVLVKGALERGIRHIWLQQGAAGRNTLNGIDSGRAEIVTGQCIMMFAEPVKSVHAFHRWLKKNFGKWPR